MNQTFWVYRMVKLRLEIVQSLAPQHFVAMKELLQHLYTPALVVAIR
jgi:hypothetical protein